MKKFILFIALVVIGIAVMAQSTNKISYQAVVRDGNNRLAANTTVTVKVTIGSYEDEFTGVQTNANGLISLTLPSAGKETAFNAINWNGATITTKVTIGSETVTSTVPVTAVPYALYSSDVNPSGVTVQAIYNKMQADSLALANGITNLTDKVQADSLLLQGNIDTTSARVRSALVDTAKAIRMDFPAVNDATLTIQKNGTDVGTFTANQSTAGTINIAVPTNVSELDGIDAYATLAKVQADSLALGTLIDKNKAAIEDSSAHIRAEIKNATLTIQTNGTTTGTFTANQGTDATINIDVPAAQVQSNWTEADNTLPSYIQNKPTLATVATTGNYTDLSGLPAINDATLTIQKNGTDLGTFTANQSTAGTINITVPTTVAELTDANDYATKTGNNTFSGTNDFSGTVTVPQAVNPADFSYTNDEMQAVAYKDLMLLFDSLTKRIADLEGLASTMQDLLTVPMVSTDDITDTTASKATLNGTVISEGRTPVTERGFCWNTTGMPTITDTKIEKGTGTGSFSHVLTGLNPANTYYIRAYATSAGGTTYGDEVSFQPLVASLSVTTNLSGEPALTCNSEPVVITYTATLENDDLANYTLQWYVDDVAQAGKTDATAELTHTVSNPNMVVKCEATRAGVDPIEGDTTLAVTVNSTPNPSMTLTRLEGNAGDDWGKVSITDVVEVATAYWIWEGDTVGTWNADKTSVLPVGTYNVTMVNSAGCKKSTSVTTRTSPVCVAKTAISSTLETTYELAGKQFVKTIKDHEGNQYNVAQIGDRCWTRENMRAVTSPTLPAGQNYLRQAPKYNCQPSRHVEWPGDSATCVQKNWGAQYNKAARNDIYAPAWPEIFNTLQHTTETCIPNITSPWRGICPEGWHLAEGADFTSIRSAGFNQMGMLASNDGDGVNSWKTASGNSPGNASYAQRNLSGFSAVPAGMDGGSNTKDYAIFWTQESGTTGACVKGKLYAIQYNYTTQNFLTQVLWNQERCAVRCIRDTKPAVSISKSHVSPVALDVPVTYTASISGDDPSRYTYTWKVNDAVQSGETSETFTKAESSYGNYTITCEATDGTTTISKWINTSVRIDAAVSTTAATSVTSTSATVGGIVEAVGAPSAYTITERGICYSTSNQFPRVSQTGNTTKVAAAGAIAGDYTITLTGLTPNTTYYVCAYVTNSYGTTHGEVITFTTPAE